MIAATANSFDQLDQSKGFEGTYTVLPTLNEALR